MKIDQHLTFADVPDAHYRINNQPQSLLGNPGILILLGAVLLAATPITSSALTLPVNQDTTVDSAAPTANYGGSGALAIRNMRSTQRTFAKFDLTALPKDAVITQATLRMFVNRVETPGALTINMVTADWSERSLTHANAPTLMPLAAAPLTVTTADKGRYLNYDITDIVQDWQATPKFNYGIAISPPPVGTPVKVFLDSKEDDDTSHPMEIEVAFEGLRGAKGERGEAGPQGAKGETGAFGLQGIVGLQGIQGAKGDKGDTGPQGVPGAQGSQGLPGNLQLAGQKCGLGSNVIGFDDVGNILCSSDLRQPVDFLFTVSSTVAGPITRASWPGGNSAKQCFGGICVTAQFPIGTIDGTNGLGWGATSDKPSNCTITANVPDCSGLLAFGRVANNLPICSSALNSFGGSGIATAKMTLHCIP